MLTTRCPPGCLVLADLNFPASSICQCGPLEIRADGERAPGPPGQGGRVSSAPGSEAPLWPVVAPSPCLQCGGCRRAGGLETECRPLCPPGLGIPPLLEALLKLLPLDTYVESPVRAESPLHPAALRLGFPFCGLHRAHLPWSGGEKPCVPKGP